MIIFNLILKLLCYELYKNEKKGLFDIILLLVLSFVNILFIGVSRYFLVGT